MQFVMFEGMLGGYIKCSDCARSDDKWRGGKVELFEMYMEEEESVG
jgi:hypothetical protein